MRKKKIISGNYFNKYKSKNILVKFVMKKYFKTLQKLIGKTSKNKILDLGCGEGEIIRFLIKRYNVQRVTGIDIDPVIINNLKKEHPSFKFYKLFLDENIKIKGIYDLSLCLEVLEHIPNYKKAIKNISTINTKKLIISVPNEPFFRLANIFRLKYLSSLGNTPGHVNNFSYFKFKKLIRQNFKNKRITFKCCYLWLFAVIENKKCYKKK
jgi:2-polyprenyl-3-methyl-5-hydroxy-6-metoxy-1,4-benzoquinol methylase